MIYHGGFKGSLCGQQISRISMRSQRNSISIATISLLITPPNNNQPTMVYEDLSQAKMMQWRKLTSIFKGAKRMGWT
jgi:hypothetical protein